MVDNFVYCFGGIQAGQGKQPFNAAKACERYDPVQNVWEDIEIDGAVRLSSFAWTPLGSPDRIMILGGSDGDMLLDSAWVLDIKERKFTMEREMSSTNPFALGTIVYRQAENKVYCVGGVGNEGVNTCATMGGKWKRMNDDMGRLAFDSDKEKEFLHNTWVYFE